MLGSPLLGTAVGLVLLFASIALLCSAVTESLSNFIELRAKYLLTGLRAMLDDPDTASGNGRFKGGTTLHEAVKNRDATLKAAAMVRSWVGGAPDKEIKMTAIETPQWSLPLVLGSSMSDRATRWGSGGRRRAEVGAKLDKWGTAISGIGASWRSRSAMERPEPVLTTALFASPLLASMQSRRIGWIRNGRLRNPQYLSGRTLARALVDLLVPTDPDGQPPVVVDVGTLRRAVENLPQQLPARRQLLLFLSQAGTTIATFEAAVEQWYDEEMGKISGWYKRWSRVALGIVGLIVAGAANIDTLQVAHTLYVDVPVQQAVLAAADSGSLCTDLANPTSRAKCVSDELDRLDAQGLPIMWVEAPHLGDWSLPLKVLGLALTAFAVSFGAPFWFEALSKLGSLRNAGKRPDDP